MKFQMLVFCGLLCLVAGAVVRKWHKSEDGSQFYIESEQKYNWFSAWNECARKNMSLMAIDTYEKHLQINALIRNLFANECPPLWLGGHDHAVQGRYEWTATGEVFSFTSWGPSQPNMADDHCILIYTDFNWHDWTCSKLLGFICEENRYIKESSMKSQMLDDKLQANLEALEELKQKVDQNDSHKYKNLVVNFNTNPKFEYLYGNATDLKNLKLA